MNIDSLKKHIAPVLHNAGGNVLGVIVLGSIVILSKHLDFTIPFWQVLVLLVIFLFFIGFLSNKKNQKQANAIAAVCKEHEGVIAKIQQQHRKAIADQQGMRHRDLDKVAEQNDDLLAAHANQAEEIADLKKKHQDELHIRNRDALALGAGHIREIAALKKSHAEDMAALRRKFDELQMADGFTQTEFARLNKDKDAEIIRLKSELETLTKEVKERYPLFFAKVPLFDLNKATTPRTIGGYPLPDK